MMSLKIFVLALLAIGTVQASSEYRQNRDLITDLIEQLRKLAHGIIESASVIAQNALLAAKKVLDDLGSLIGSAYDKAIKTIDDLIAKAKEEGMDISECVTGKKEALEQLKDTSLFGMGKCMDEGKNNFNSSMIEVEDMVDSIFFRIEKIWDQFLNPSCGIICVGGLIREASSLVIETTGNALKVTQKFTKMGADMAICITSMGGNVSGQIVVIVDDIQKCYDNQPKPTTPAPTTAASEGY